MSNKQLLYLNQKDFEFREHLRLSYSVFSDPNILEEKKIKTICDLFNISDTKARSLKKAHLFIWGDTSISNREFEKNWIAQRFLELAMEAKNDGESEKEAEFLEKYSKLKGFDKEVEKDKPRSLPKLMRSTTEPKVVEDIDHEIIE
jgi:hypothetical protein